MAPCALPGGGGGVRGGWVAVGVVAVVDGGRVVGGVDGGGGACGCNGGGFTCATPLGDAPERVVLGAPRYGEGGGAGVFNVDLKSTFFFL